MFRKLTRSTQQGGGIANIVTKNGIARGMSSDVNGGLSVGDQVHGYTLQKVGSIKEFELELYEFTHDKTQAQHLHVASEDSNNVFSVSFPTQPTDSTGVAHILEHTALCGSEKFPVRDPFFNMLKRSMSTFMNAMTASDFTTYPFSTLNPVDFRNLMSVYLDATFFPRLDRDDFMQEGHRLEFTDGGDLEFKGVVFNEMKGALSNAESLYYDRLQHHLYPNTTYHHNSGGLPENIPDLTYEQLKEFHRVHYHPSNAKFFTYGNFPVEDHLQYINQEVLSRFDPIRRLSAVEDVDRYTGPQVVQVMGPANSMLGPTENQVITSNSVLANNVTNSYETFKMEFLSTLLFEGPTSPFYEALITSGIGSSYSPATGYIPYQKEAFLSVGLQGIRAEDVDKVQAVIRETYRKVANEGVDMDRVHSLMHQMELSTRIKGPDFGLNVLWGVMRNWAHHGDPAAPLNITKFVSRLEEDLAKNPSLFENMIEHYVLDNPHELQLTMIPSEEYFDVEKEQELQRLTDISAGLSEQDRQEINSTAARLLERQDEKPDVGVLPTLTRQDISETGETTELKQEKTTFGRPLFVSEQPTNGVVFVKTLIPTDFGDREQLQYLPLYTQTLAKLGAGGRNREELSREIERRTGGIGVTATAIQNPGDIEQWSESIMVSSKALSKNAEAMSDVLGDVMMSPWRGEETREHLSNLIRQQATNATESIVHNGHVIARGYAESSVSGYHELCSHLSGLRPAQFLNGLVAEMEENQDAVLDRVLEKFQWFDGQLDDFSDARSMIVGDKKTLKEKELSLGYLGRFGKEGGHESVSREIYEPRDSKRFVSMPFPVNFAAKAVKTVPYYHEDYAKLVVLAKLMSSNFLHREIREKGGAYGSGAVQTPGVMSWFSYRDPNNVTTLETFERAVEWIVEGEFSERDMDEALLSVFSQLDAPTSMSVKGMSEFLNGIPKEHHDQRRQEYLAVSKADIIDVANRYLVGKQGSYVVLGNLDDSTRSALDDDWVIEGN